jgi:hypothetical protein
MIAAFTREDKPSLAANAAEGGEIVVRKAAWTD